MERMYLLSAFCELIIKNNAENYENNMPPLDHQQIDAKCMRFFQSKAPPSNYENRPNQSLLNRFQVQF